MTSPIGAAWHDIQTVVAKRDPRVELIFAPAQVQGTGSVESMISALDALAQLRDLDVVILARGGGAAEELWPFNDEALVRALARFPRPVCSGVGHETDVTLIDFAADKRAPTPSAAAEMAVPVRSELVGSVDKCGSRLGAAMLSTLIFPFVAMALRKGAPAEESKDEPPASSGEIAPVAV